MIQEPDPIEPENKPETPSEQKTTRRGGIGALAAAAVVLATKFALVLKLLLPSWTFLLSLVFYVAFFGWRLGIVILLVLAAHELGHYFAYRAYGLAARLPVFVPFLGAYTQGALAPDLEQDAYIALAGPLTGLALAAACYGVGIATGDRFWLACADISAFLNLFNMIPVLPFDGGRVIGAVWPPLWFVGVLVFIAAAAWLHVPIVLVALIALLGVPAMLASFRGTPDPRAAAMTNAARARVGFWYVATSLALIVLIGQAHAALPANNAI
ncbi:MAG: site-2 protease family protein [Candidatus Eremiobacteraeota bacterium]|nr:site-2 protease family protein [Candidatus Eremiobacteraeota bacterium]